VFKRTAFLVMDEADRVLDATFEDDLRALLPVSGVASVTRKALLWDAPGMGSLHSSSSSSQEEHRGDAAVTSPAGVKQGLLCPVKGCRLIISACVAFPAQALPPGDQRQTLLFSATMTQALIKLQQNALDDAFVFEVSPDNSYDTTGTALQPGPTWFAFQRDGHALCNSRRT
jgi:hypothetical protein